MKDIDTTKIYVIKFFLEKPQLINNKYFFLIKESINKLTRYYKSFYLVNNLKKINLLKLLNTELKINSKYLKLSIKMVDKEFKNSNFYKGSISPLKLAAYHAKKIDNLVNKLIKKNLKKNQSLCVI